MPGIPESPAKGRFLEAGPVGKGTTNLGVGEPENLPHQPPPEACQCPAPEMDGEGGEEEAPTPECDPGMFGSSPKAPG